MRTLLLFLTIFITSPIFSQNWVDTGCFGGYIPLGGLGGGHSMGKSICKDKTGDIYVAGNFYLNNDYNNDPEYLKGIFIRKYSPLGVLIWQKTYYASGHMTLGIIKITLDNNDNLVILGGYGAGNYGDTLNIEGYSFIGNAGYFLRLNSIGNFISVKNLPYICPVNISFCDNGSYVLSGMAVKDTILNLCALSGGLYFLGNFDSNDNCVFIKQNQKGAIRDLMSVTDKNKNIFLCFRVSDSLIVEGNIYNPVAYGGSIIKYDSLGNFKWFKNFGSTLGGEIRLFGFDSDEQGNIYVGGWYDHAMYIDSFYLPNNSVTSGTSAMNYPDAFVAKFDPNGNAVWVRTINTNAVDDLYDLKVAGKSLYFTGSSSSSSFGSFAFNSGRYIIKADTSGNGELIKYVTGDLSFSEFLPDTLGNIYLTGMYSGSPIIGSYTFPDATWRHPFYFLKLEPDAVSTVLPIEILGSSLTIYPNPTSGIFQINYSSTEKGDGHLNIIDSKGKIVYSESFQGNYKKTIDLSNKSKGVYFVEIIADKKRSVKKIVLN